MCYNLLKTPVKTKKEVLDALHESEMLLPKLVIQIPNQRVIDYQACKERSRSTGWLPLEQPNQIFIILVVLQRSVLRVAGSISAA